jgi:hypothetical protein
MDAFLHLSTELTGFSRVELLGTGVAERLFEALESILADGVLDELTEHRQSAEAVLADVKLGPVARNIILAWYTGTWTALPVGWHASYGVGSGDRTHVLFPEAYVAGLQWLAAGAHPAGARQQGYGAWSVSPSHSGPQPGLEAGIQR